MNLFLVLLRRSRALLASAAAASLVYGGCSVMLIAVVNRAINADRAALGGLVLPFVGLAIAVLVGQVVAGVLFTRFSQHAVADLRRHICERVMAAPYRRIEEAGGHKIRALLADDTDNVAQFFIGLPVLLANTLIVAGSFVYLASLSWAVFLLACAVIVAGSLGYLLNHKRVLSHLREAGQQQDRLFRHFDAMIGGAKELRLHRGKTHAFRSQVLDAAIEGVRHHRTVGLSLFALSSSWGRFLFFALIGVALFFPLWSESIAARAVTGYVIVFIYIMAPLENLLMHIPLYNMAKVSARRIEAVTADMADTEAPATAPHAAAPAQLALRGVTHRYYRESEDDVFQLGPVDLHFSPGELVFLVGGNGCGKTTLAKLIVGLYVQEQGDIVCDGEPVSDTNRDRYRQRFSAVFSDFHLFETLVGLHGDDLDVRANRWLERLHLRHKVQVSGGAFTTRDLSQGQRKRLALVAACLEDRPFLVFDEWAADQDPVFKDVFYRELLPELARQGKTVLVITHDDRYFHLADRVLHMENGQVTEAAPDGAAARVHDRLVAAAGAA